MICSPSFEISIVEILIAQQLVFFCTPMIRKKENAINTILNKESFLYLKLSSIGQTMITYLSLTKWEVIRIGRCSYQRSHFMNPFRLSFPNNKSLRSSGSSGGSANCDVNLLLLTSCPFRSFFRFFGLVSLFPIWVPVCLRSERQLSASTNLEQPRNANVIERNA